MDKIKITCDSTCDLSPELCEKYDIEMIPLSITLGDESYRDGVDIQSQDVYSYASASGQLPKTAAVSVGGYESVFAKYVGEGYSVIHINISSDFSSCYQNACLAAEEVGNVYPFDSRNLSAGSGYYAIAARELADAGCSTIEEIHDKLEEIKQKINVSFVIQTLDFLKMGGRCSGVAALGANLLKIRPEILVRDGKMTVGKKYRGNRVQSIAAYIRGKLEGRHDIDLSRAFVLHGGLPEEEFRNALALVKELQPFEEIFTGTVGCTIASHAGPDVLGILFLTKK